MSNPGDEDATPIASVRQLAEHIALGCKPRTEWRIGTEHEKFGFYRDDHAAPAYDPDDRPGIRQVLEGLHGAAPDAWQRISDGGALIGLKGQGAEAGRSISLEPGGQFELSGAPLATLHETQDEMAAHLEAVRTIAGPMGLGFAPLGFHPIARRDQLPWMPKSRYAIMRRYMPEVGSMGLDMMLRTCTVQVNLDYGSEEDMVRKLRVALALQPVATALFASSPFKEGRASGFASTRAQVWTDVDNARSGMPDAFFAPGFGFERFVDWVLDVPMYFVARQGRLIDVAGASFRAWMNGAAIPGLEGLSPTVGDFDDHLTTVFTDVRLKRFLEMRGADAGTPEMMLAQSALWVGLLYDDAALTAAERLVAAHGPGAYVALRAAVPREGLSARAEGVAARDLAEAMCAIAADGLRARGQLRDGDDESRYLAPLAQALAEGTQSDCALARYRDSWHGDASRALDEGCV